MKKSLLKKEIRSLRRSINKWLALVKEYNRTFYGNPTKMSFGEWIKGKSNGHKQSGQSEGSNAIQSA